MAATAVNKVTSARIGLLLVFGVGGACGLLWLRSGASATEFLVVRPSTADFTPRRRAFSYVKKRKESVIAIITPSLPKPRIIASATSTKLLPFLKTSRAPVPPSLALLVAPNGLRPRSKRNPRPACILRWYTPPLASSSQPLEFDTLPNP